MALEIHRLEERRNMKMYELKDRIYTDLSGEKVVADPKKHKGAKKLLGAPGHTIPLSQAVKLGLPGAADLEKRESREDAEPAKAKPKADAEKEKKEKEK